MLLPWGLMLSFINEKVRSVKQIIIAGFGLSFCIETIQFITRRGTFELDDLFNNTLGTLWGFGIYLLVEKLILSSMTNEKKE
jgi:glycopeptide antibiotics resistance protein